MMKSSRKLPGKISLFPTAAAALVLLLVAGLAGLHLERNAEIREVRFTGNRFVSSDTLLAAVESPVGEHADSLVIAGVMESVRSLSWVKECRVRVEAGRRMVVEVEERTPIALLVESPRTWVDEEGVVLPPLRGVAVDLPLLHGFGPASPGSRISGSEFGQVRDFLLQARENGVGRATISEVLWDREAGVVALSHENGVKLIFGRDRYEEKFRYWQAFYREVIREEGIAHLTSVDLRFRNQIVTR